MGSTCRFLGIMEGHEREAFVNNIRYKVALGDKIYFWLDTWVGDKPLSEDFQVSFLVLEIVKLWSVIIWLEIPGRHFSEMEEIQFFSRKPLIKLLF